MNLRSARLLMASIAFAALPVFAQNLATVNGKAIPASRADAIVKQMVAQGQKDTPQLRAMVKDEMIGREILLQEATKKGLASSAEVKEQIENAKQMIIINALRADYVKSHPVSDAEVKAEYDRYKQAAGDTDYRVRHILLASNDEAKAVIVKLKAGSSFEDMAKQYSKDANSAANGGDLDWGNPGKYPKAFSDAMVKLSKGQYTDVPAQSEIGFHVIKLEDTRSSKFPAFDEIKPQVKKSLLERKLKEYQDSLMKKAKVTK